jgi:hypothetical protein
MDLVVAGPEVPAPKARASGRGRDDPSPPAGSIQPLDEPLEGGETILGHEAFHQAVRLGSSKDEELEGIFHGIREDSLGFDLRVHPVPPDVIRLKLRPKSVEVGDSGISLPNLTPEAIESLPGDEGTRSAFRIRPLLAFRRGRTVVGPSPDEVFETIPVEGLQEIPDEREEEENRRKLQDSHIGSPDRPGTWPAGASGPAGKTKRSCGEHKKNT